MDNILQQTETLEINLDEAKCEIDMPRKQGDECRGAYISYISDYPGRYYLDRNGWHMGVIVNYNWFYNKKHAEKFLEELKDYKAKTNSDKKPEIKTAEFVITDELHETAWYECPECGFDYIMEGCRYCGNCGIRIKTEDINE